jgi:YVTN family beta-propeller protein
MHAAMQRVALSAVIAAAGTVHARQIMTRAAAGNPDGVVECQQFNVASSDILRFGGEVGPQGVGDLTPTALPLGTNPEADDHSDVKFLPDGSGVVVANRRSKNLVIFNPDTRALIAAVPLSGSPQSVAVNPAGTLAVTANLYEGTASIVNLTTRTETATVPTGPFPATALITPDGTRALIHNNGRVGSSGPFGSLSVINLATNAVERTITTGDSVQTFSVTFEWEGVGFSSSGPVIYDNSKVLYPVYGGSSTVNSQVLIIDVGTGAVTPVDVPGVPRNIVVSGTKAYIVHISNVHKVTEIDVPTAAVTHTFTSTVDLQGPEAINAAGTKLAVAVQNSFQILDLATGTFTANIGPLSNPSDLLTTHDGNRVAAVNFYGTVADFSGNVVATFNGPSNYTIGAASPVTDRVAMVSAAFGEDMMTVNTTVGSVALLSAGPSGPPPEADKPRTVAVNPAGTRAVTAEVLSQTATVIDTTTNTRLVQVPIQRRAGNVEITPNGGKAVIASRDGTGVDIIDLATNTVTPVFLQAAPARADAVVFTADSQFAYVNVITGGDGIYRINLSTNAVSPKVLTGNMGSVGALFAGIALSPDGSKLVTCDSFVNTLTFVDTASMTVTATVPVANAPIRAVFSQGGTRLYVASTTGNTFSVLDTTVSPPAILGTANIGNSPTEIRLSPDGARAYVQATQAASPFSPLIAVVDVTVTPPALVTQWIFPTNPSWGIGGHRVSADGSKVYVSRSTASWTFGNGGLVEAQDGTFTVVDAPTGAVLEEVPTGRLAASMAKSAGDTVFVTTDILADGATIIAGPSTCYPNCDSSTTPPVLNIQDFACFLNRFASADPYANCDGSTTPPVLNVLDFACFLNSFAGGCT